MTVPRLSSRWWFAGFGLALAVAIAAGVYAWPRLRPLPTEPLRIGYAFDPPYHQPGNDGRPAGMAIDVVSEAARRLGLPLEWHYLPGNSWMLVRDGQADLWPLMAILPERKGFIHVSAPYLTSDQYLLGSGPLPTPFSDYEGEVGIQEIPIMHRFLGEILPKARPRGYPKSTDVASAVCAGDVPVGLVSLGSAVTTLRLPAESCPRQLRSVRVPIEPVGLGIGSTLRFAFVADRLRRELDVMAEDGTLAGLLMPYSTASAIGVMEAFELDETRARARQLTWALGLSSVALGSVLVLAVLLHRSNRRALAAVSARQAIEATLREREHVEAIGRLAGGVAHDFNNEMTVIGGYCEMLLADAPEAQRAPLEEIQKACARSGALVRQLLAFGRRQRVQPERVSPAAVVSDLAPALRRALGEDIELAVAADPGDTEVMIDPGQLRQVALNLSVNARDAMPGGGRLEFATAAVTLDAAHAAALELPAGRYVRIRVSDTGSGMDEETRRHAFEPFYTTKPFGAGSGLGLATVYGIARQAGGAASITSAPGHGTTIELYLPAVGPAA